MENLDRKTEGATRMISARDSKLYEMDGFEFLDSLDDESVDLLFLDPPFEKWEEFCDQGLIDKAKRVTKKDGNILCFTNQSFDFHLRKVVDDIFRRELIWTFLNGGAWVSKKLPLVSCQKIFHLTKSTSSFFNPRTGEQYSDKTKDFKRESKVWQGYDLVGKEFEKSEEGTWLRDVLHFSKPIGTGRTCCKPNELLRILVTCYCKPDGIVVDPFAGSGRMMKACLALSTKYLGSEIDPDAVEYASREMKEEISQLTLEI